MKQSKIILMVGIVMLAIITTSMGASLSVQMGNVIYEDAEDNNTEGWNVVDSSPADAEINNIYDEDKASRVIQFVGAGTANSYELGGLIDPWNNTQNKIIKWSMNYGESFIIFINISTSNGQRYLQYTSNDSDGGVSGSTINIGLGAESKNGTWQIITRDLEADLKKYQPTNDLLAVDGFLVRGSGLVDDIELFSWPVYEDAEDNNTEGWSVTDSSPEGAMISNIYDEDKASRVIQFSGAGTANSYTLGINDTQYKSIKWSMNYGESFIIYVSTLTSNGQRYIQYTPDNSDGGKSGSTIHIGLGSESNSGTWQTFTRDLEADLKQYEPTNDLLAVNTFIIRGNGLIDNITLMSDLGQDTMPPIITLIGDNPMYLALGDTFTDPGVGATDNLDVILQVTESGTVDTSTIGSYSRTYTVTDKAGNLGSATRTVHVASNTGTVYEDAEDENTEGWRVYDSSPSGAQINNILDNDKASRVIQFVGAGTANSYALEGLNNTQDKSIKWSMKYGETFIVYVKITTSNGSRYIKYTPNDSDGGKSGSTINIGLGSESNNGTWQTFTRDLEADLKQYDPTSDLLAVNTFIIRGSGLVDDIEVIPSEADPVDPCFPDPTVPECPISCEIDPLLPWCPNADPCFPVPMVPECPNSCVIDPGAPWCVVP